MQSVTISIPVSLIFTVATIGVGAASIWALYTCYLAWERFAELCRAEGFAAAEAIAEAEAVAETQAASTVVKRVPITSEDIRTDMRSFPAKPLREVDLPKPERKAEAQAVSDIDSVLFKLMMEEASAADIHDGDTSVIASAASRDAGTLVTPTIKRSSVRH